MELLEWLELGIAKGWVSEPYCGMHDGFPLTEEEDVEIEDGGDPCITTMRLWGEL
jgi:hypothetical protein